MRCTRQARLIGMFDSAFIATAFVFEGLRRSCRGNEYIRRSDARGTHLQSHLRLAAAHVLVRRGTRSRSFSLSLPLFFVLVGFVTFPIGIFIIGVSVIYRVARGFGSSSRMGDPS